MHAKKLKRAFTLLELLVAVGITALIAGLMLTATTQLLSLWHRQQAAHEQATVARRVLDQVEQDLSSALVRPDGQSWLAAEIIDTPSGLANHGWLLVATVPKPANGGSLRPLPAFDGQGRRNLEAARFGLSGVWLRCVTSTLESGGSLPAIVAYQVARRPVTGDAVATNPAPVRYALYRSAITNEETFASGYDVTAAAYASPTNTPPGSLAGGYRTTRNVMNPSHANLLASHVVDFGCWFYARNADGSLRLIFPATETDLRHVALGGSTTDDTRFPVVADIFIRVLSESGATELAALEAGARGVRPPRWSDDAAWWWSVVEENSAVFTRRVELNGGKP